jgi:hypothetical protein
MWKAQDAIRRRSWEGCRHGCYHQAVKTFEELKLWNDVIFFDVPKHRHFVCSQCGGRHVKVMPIRRDMAAVPDKAEHR